MSAQTLDISFSQSGHDITLYVDGTLRGKIYGNSFVVTGSDESIISGTFDGNSVEGTFEGDDDYGWYWGTFTGSKR